MNTHHYDLPIRILICKDGNDFVAHALELDLLGYGKTEKAAMSELREMMNAQISYASQTNRPELVWHPAPKEFFDRWEKACEAALRGVVSPDRPIKMQTKAMCVTVTPEDLKAAKIADFARTSEPQLAKAS